MNTFTTIWLDPGTYLDKLNFAFSDLAGNHVG